MKHKEKKDWKKRKNKASLSYWNKISHTCNRSPPRREDTRRTETVLKK